MPGPSSSRDSQPRRKANLQLFATKERKAAGKVTDGDNASCRGFACKKERFSTTETSQQTSIWPNPDKPDTSVAKRPNTNCSSFSPFLGETSARHGGKEPPPEAPPRRAAARRGGRSSQRERGHRAGPAGRPPAVR